MAAATQIEPYAQALADAFCSGRMLAPLPAELVHDDATAAALQDAAIAAVARPVVGWKLGATSAQAQAIMQTDAPFFGPVFEDRVWENSARVDLPRGFRGFECEFALRIGADLPPREGGYRRDQLTIAIDAVVPAIELVATRQALDGTGDARLARADFGFNHGLVLGAPLTPPPLDALTDTGVVARVDDVEVGRGSGASVLGDPREALVWFTRQGVGLRAGDLVSTGTCTGIAAITPGQRAEADFGPLGRVTFMAA